MTRRGWARLDLAGLCQPLLDSAETDSAGLHWNCLGWPVMGYARLGQLSQAGLGLAELGPAGLISLSCPELGSARVESAETETTGLWVVLGCTGLDSTRLALFFALLGWSELSFAEVGCSWLGSGGRTKLGCGGDWAVRGWAGFGWSRLGLAGLGSTGLGWVGSGSAQLG